jgi:hypothetical protein
MLGGQPTLFFFAGGMLMVQFVDWQENIEADLFVRSIDCRVYEQSQKWHNYSTSFHCCKTSDLLAEMEAAKQLILDEYAGRKYIKIELEAEGEKLCTQ